MSRSRKKEKWFNNAGGPRKWFKRFLNKIKRQKTKEQLHHGKFDDIQKVDEPWDWWEDAADGKHYWKDAPDEAMRK